MLALARYVFTSHDGFGLGHVRRNTLLARAVLARDPAARVVVVTGVAVRAAWLGTDPRIEVVTVPPLLKGSDGAYRAGLLPFEEAVAVRARRFLDTVATQRPDVVVVDRHPYGTAGELHAGLARAREQGAALVLGLRDVLDQPAVVRREIAGRGWADAAELYDRALVYGARHVVDHQAEYGLPMTPHYVGWVSAPPSGRRPQPRLLAVAAGGGGDGAAVYELGAALLGLRREWQGVIAAGPYAGDGAHVLDDATRGRLQVTERVPSCGVLFASAQAVLCMAGYNTTVEALAAGKRPILVPRRSPRREQAIRAGRFAALGLADVVDEGAAAAEVDWLLGRARDLSEGALADAGVRLDGADQAALAIVELARSRSAR